ncbi:MAG: tetratricopeptide repeat protein [candidate division WOR-3 bacterium]|nr:MAG: tetratricopeptide repeat protein [candidate division WOR-3 bacterium]
MTQKRRPNIVLLMVLCLSLMTIAFADVGESMRRGNRLYSDGKYDEALLSYQDALVQEPDNPKIHYNIGRALYKMERYDEAISEFELGLLEKDEKFQANTFYNIGNCQYKKGQLDAAIHTYKTSLLIDHTDIPTKQNLEFCLKIKEQMENQPQSDSTGQQQPQPQTQPQKTEISKEEAERILQAMQSREKENQKKAREPEKPERVEKDW